MKEKMSPGARRRRDRRITRAALQHPSMSAFSVLFGSGCDQSLITVTGLDHRSFRYILAKFSTVYSSFTPYSADGNITRLPQTASSKGLPRTLSPVHCLGLLLAWTRTRGSEYVLCMLFGVTGFVCSLFLRFGRRILIRVLRDDPIAAVRMPDDDEVSQYKEAIRQSYSLLTDAYAVADGLKLTLEETSDAVIAILSNIRTGHHFITNGFRLPDFRGNRRVTCWCGRTAHTIKLAPEGQHSASHARVEHGVLALNVLPLLFSDWEMLFEKLKKAVELFLGESGPTAGTRTPKSRFCLPSLF